MKTKKLMGSFSLDCVLTRPFWVIWASDVYHSGFSLSLATKGALESVVYFVALAITLFSEF